MALPAKPTATGHNETAAPGTSVPLSTLFSYFAASGDSIVGFDVEEASNNDGYLTDNGVEQPAGVLNGNSPSWIPITRSGSRCSSRERAAPTRLGSTKPSTVPLGDAIKVSLTAGLAEGVE
jgi:hypothetical protein